MLTALPAKLELAQEGRLRRQQPDPTRGNPQPRRRCAALRRTDGWSPQSIAFIYAPDRRPGEVRGRTGDRGARAASSATRSPRPAARAAGAGSRRARRPGAALRVLLRPGHLLCERRPPGVGGAQAAVPDRRRGDGVFSYVHVDDAAAAARRPPASAARRASTTSATTSRRRCGEWLPVYAEAVGAKPPLRVPKLLARIVAGRAAVDFATTLRGASNEKAKRELGWRPGHSSWRTGLHGGAWLRGSANVENGDQSP